jgi:hypothetical protein
MKQLTDTEAIHRRIKKSTEDYQQFSPALQTSWNVPQFKKSSCKNSTLPRFFAKADFIFGSLR